MMKRRIDVIRDAAIKLNLEGNNAGAIQDLYSLGSRMLSIHARGIFELQLPDQIDPAELIRLFSPRINRFSVLVRIARTLFGRYCRARRLFRVGFIPPPVDLVRAQEIVFDGLQDLLAMRDIADTVTSQVTGLIEGFNAAKVKRGLPSLPNLKPQCEMFMQKAKHVTASMRDLGGSSFQMRQPKRTGRRQSSLLLVRRPRMERKTPARLGRHGRSFWRSLPMPGMRWSIAIRTSASLSGPFY